MISGQQSGGPYGGRSRLWCQLQATMKWGVNEAERRGWHLATASAAAERLYTFSE